jgi:MSHA biogenesis protein MshO
MTNRFHSRHQYGFTLVEAILVIVIIGLLGGMVAVFIRAPMQGYADSVARAELSDVADLALRRMARDLRLALPNSIRVSDDGNSLEFLMTRAGGRYLSAQDSVDTLPVLDFVDPANKNLTVVGPMPDDAHLTLNQDYLVVNNLGTGFAPADAYGFGSDQSNIAIVKGRDDSSNQLTLDSNPFARQVPASPSPSQRFFIVSGPVSYYCGLEADGTTRLLTRQSGYQINANLVANPVPPGSTNTRSLLAGRVKSCRFQYQSLASQRRSALVILTLELQPRNSTDATIKLVHQVHVDNAP